MTYNKNKTIFLKRTFFIFLIIFLIYFPNSVLSQGNHFFGLKTVVIDPGHGGKDPGSPGTGRYNVYEKDIALDISIRLGELIKKEFPELNVIFTRQNDQFVKLSERSQIANSNNADLFISIHCDAFTNEIASGSSSYVIGPHKNESNLKIAMRENSSILLEENFDIEYEGFNPNEPESYIALTMYQSEYIGYALDFASKVQNEFEKSSERKNRGVKQAGFLVLSRTTMPSVLIEVGFLTNKKEEDYLISKKGKNEVSSSIFEAFKKYKKNIDFLASEAYSDMSKNKNLTDSSSERNKDLNNFLTVQFFASKDSINFNNKNLNEDLIFNIYENNLFKYFYGKTLTYSDAKNIQNKMKLNGFFDSFIVGFINGNKTDLNKVLTILDK